MLTETNWGIGTLMKPDPMPICECRCYCDCATVWRGAASSALTGGVAASIDYGIGH